MPLDNISEQHELIDNLTPLGLFIVNCRDAANPNLKPEEKQHAALMARTELTGLALQKVYGRTLSPDELGKALTNPKVEETKQEILVTLRQDKDPVTLTAVNTIFPLEPTDGSLPLTSNEKNLVQREPAVWGIGEPTFGKLLRVIEKHFKDTSKP